MNGAGAARGPDYVQQLDLLRREEQLSRRTLATKELNSQQRRIHQHQLRQLAGRYQVLEVAQRAIDAGWMPFRPSDEWHAGFVEDPRILGGQLSMLPLPTAVMASLLCAWGLVVGGALEPLAAAASACVVGAGLQTLLRQLSGWLDRQRLTRLVRSRPFGPNGRSLEQLLIFNAPMPAQAALAFRRARESGLFEQFLVCSPRQEDFRQVSAAAEPTLGLLDPVLVGVIGSETFLIARWDLSADLGLVHQQPDQICPFVRHEWLAQLTWLFRYEPLGLNAEQT